MEQSSASQAKCSCGEKSALQCSCDKATTENEVTGPRCSCRTYDCPALYCSANKQQALAQLDLAHATGLPRRTLLQVAPLVLVVKDLLVCTQQDRLFQQTRTDKP